MVVQKYMTKIKPTGKEQDTSLKGFSYEPITFSRDQSGSDTFENQARHPNLMSVSK
jgi:hypothetical protein